jgi:hypothetical protein
MMHTKTPSVALFAVLMLSGCATSTEEKHAIPAEGVAVVAPEETAAPLGSHFRSKKKDTILGATNKMSGEDFKRESNANRTDPTGDQIMQARTDGR